MKGVETVALFNPAAFETPESVQIDRRGNTYISMALTRGSGRSRLTERSRAWHSCRFVPMSSHAETAWAFRSSSRYSSCVALTGSVPP